LVANFKPDATDTYVITVFANPPEGGTVFGGGTYISGTPATVKATANTGYEFVNWTEDGVEIPDAGATYTFIVTEDRTLTANFEKVFTCTVTVEVNNSDYGVAKRSGVYKVGSKVRAEALVKECYRFANWTIDGKEVSTDSVYEFEVTKDVTLTANFYALDFDTYCPTFWNNTFMLNRKKLAEEDYQVTGCKWFKNGTEERDTRTIDEFSYSAGPNITDLLEPAPTYYMFRLTTKNFGDLCSSNKTLTGYRFDFNTGNQDDGNFIVYPNPVVSGSSFTIEGIYEGVLIQIYNLYGFCIKSSIADDISITFTLDLPPGVYVLHVDNKQLKIVVVR